MEKNCNNLKVAVIQAAPVIMDVKATIEKTVALIKGAAAKGANLLVFPEAFISAYPRGLSFGFTVGSRSEAGREDFKRYYDNSIFVPGIETDIIASQAKEAGVYISIGVVEKDAANIDGTLYCTNLFFGPCGNLLGKHRKLKPTGSERCIWGEGDGSTLTTVETPYGTMGSLICWENYMVLARAAMYQKGIKIYIAPTADNREQWQSTIKHIALEGRCFVISSNQHVKKSMYPKDLKSYDELESFPENICPGGSCIVSPFGEYITEPVWDKEEIIIADIDMGEIIKSKMDLDIVGHYARPDIFKLIVNES